MARETEAQQNRRHELDKEWREIAIESLQKLTDKVAACETEIAVMKVRIGGVIAGVSLVTSAIVTLAIKWFTKS